MIGRRRGAREILVLKANELLHANSMVVNGFRYLGILTVLWGELGGYLWVLWTCRWPETGLSRQAERPTHILLISDPQLRYPLSALVGDNSFLGPFRQFLYDTNIRKNWYIAKHFHPDAVIVLGDMLASGKYASTQAEYNAYAQKFDNIFRTKHSIPTYFIPGNNDIGMGTAVPVSKHIRQYYKERFGLVDEDYQRNAQFTEYDQWHPLPEGPVEFVHNFKSTQNASQPTILFSHIPLARPDTASCGPLRERGTIRRNVGHGYQNTLGKQTTTFLLQVLQPSIVFSGDNRDYCDYIHRLGGDSDGVPPLLSLVSPDTQPSFADRPCSLPGQNDIYAGPYLFVAVVSFFGVMFANFLRAKRLPKHNLSRIPLTHRASDYHTDSDGDSTPGQPPDSAIWSPYTPTMPFSPMSKFPPMRTPNSDSITTMRATSQPSSPYASPMLSPMMSPAFDEDTEDGVYISQYPLDRGFAEGDEEHRGFKSPLLPSSSPETAGTGWKLSDRKSSLSWSWSFVFKGRRRRLTMSVPAVKSLIEYICVGDGAIPPRRRSAAWGIVVDYYQIVWPSFVVWCIITWWTTF
ncbi:Calcineurin-like phosphoesterase domain-containing protein [Pleurotus pulmonarius]